MAVIEPKALHKHLADWNLSGIFHANTLTTSCTYLKERFLISRQTIETDGLVQTPQMSDDLDKKYGIWNDIFFDSVDICNRSGIPNVYGPILFELSIDCLLDSNVDTVKITRYNPTKWEAITSDNDRYLTDLEDYRYGDFDHMITIQTKDGKLALPQYLRVITIDGPALTAFKQEKIDIYSYCRGAIRYAIFDNGSYKIKFVKRMIGPSLLSQYESLSMEKLKNRFQIPGI